MLRKDEECDKIGAWADGSPRCLSLLHCVMLVDVLLLSVIPSCCCCHRRRCHRQTTNTQRPSSSPPPPPSPLPSQSHWLQLSPPPSPCCQFHRCHRRGYRPRCCIDDANSLMQLSLAVAIAVATTVIAAIAFALAAAIAAAIALAFAVTIAAASTDVSAGTYSASPDAWACSNNSPSWRGTLELKAC